MDARSPPTHPLGSFVVVVCFLSFCTQEAQVVLECVILQRFHRVVMGAKGYKVQQITRDHDVQIKFPERDDNPGVCAC